MNRIAYCYDSMLTNLRGNDWLAEPLLLNSLLLISLVLLKFSRGNRASSPIQALYAPVTTLILIAAAARARFISPYLCHRRRLILTLYGWNAGSVIRHGPPRSLRGVYEQLGSD
jgi:hypothetical protein